MFNETDNVYCIEIGSNRSDILKRKRLKRSDMARAYHQKKLNQIRAVNVLSIKMSNI